MIWFNSPRTVEHLDKPSALLLQVMYLKGGLLFGPRPSYTPAQTCTLGCSINVID